jgi:hypothetical protein
MQDLQCDDLRRRVRHLKVRFHHGRGAKCEGAAKNNERDIPGHRRTPHFPVPTLPIERDMGVTAVTKHRFYLASVPALPPKTD